MGRELRKVKEGWEHPKYENKILESHPHLADRHIPLHGRSFSEELATWNKGKEMWDKGFVEDWHWDKASEWKPKEREHEGTSFSEWAGNKPVKKNYMPDWKEEEKTHIQLYETTTEGTPISPVFREDELEKLCEYAEKNCTTFADYRASKEGWFKMLSDGLVLHQEGNKVFI
jgi:hypothetical protein